MSYLKQIEPGTTGLIKIIEEEFVRVENSTNEYFKASQEADNKFIKVKNSNIPDIISKLEKNNGNKFFYESAILIRLGQLNEASETLEKAEKLSNLIRPTSLAVLCMGLLQIARDGIWLAEVNQKGGKSPLGRCIKHSEDYEPVYLKDYIKCARNQAVHWHDKGKWRSNHTNKYIKKIFGEMHEQSKKQNLADIAVSRLDWDNFEKFSEDLRSLGVS